MNELSVCKILFDEYGISCVPGGKTYCPFCRHKTFSIKRDDTLGKCFHPSCLHYIKSFHGLEHYKSKVLQVLESIFDDFHRELLRLKNAQGKNAYKYTAMMRNIHDQIIVDSMLGAVPSDYNVEEKFESLICEIQDSIKSKEEASKGKRGRPRTKEIDSLIKQEEVTFQIRDKLKKCIKYCSGWLCFFYADHFHRIVAIRFREPYSKKIQYFKAFEQAGLFGHNLFSSESDSQPIEFQDKLIVTEGEFNQLQLQSLWFRYCRDFNIEHSYLNSCAVGGVTNTDYETLNKITKIPVICYDNDEGGAGFVLVNKAQNLMNVEAFTTPASDSDLDGFICSFDENYKSAWEAVIKLVNGRKTFARSYEGLANQIYYVRQKRDPKDCRREHEINAEVARIIRDDFHDRGKYFYDGRTTYFFNYADKILIEIHRDDGNFLRTLANYKIMPSEKISRYIIDALRVEAFEKGLKADIHRLAYYNNDTFTLYLYNHANQVYRISTSPIKLVDNGEDGVLFLADSSTESFTVDLNWEPTSDSLFRKVITSQINFADDSLTIQERQFVFKFWFYSLFFESIMPTKPILAFIGEKGSGKTIALRKVGRLLFGKYFNVMPLPEDSKDFDAAITNSYYVAIDNADSKSNWFNDRLALAATGGRIKKRELYTDNKMIDIPIHCFIAITSRAPYFRRDDVADRLLIMRVNRFEKYISEDVLLAEVDENRDMIMTEVVFYLQRLVRLMEAHIDTDISSSFRMADFANFVLRIAGSKHRKKVENIFAKLSQAQSSFTLEDEPICELLNMWLEDARNSGRYITNTKLCGELGIIAADAKIQFQYRDNPRGFAQKISHLRSNLAEFYEIKSRRAAANKTEYSYILKEKGKNEE